MVHRRPSHKTKERREKVLSSEISAKFYVFVMMTAVLCYQNTMQCGFVFDDISAVRNNRDLRPTTSIRNILRNDFWGTPIHKEHSHKSYRPLCVLTFRLNFWLHELQPWGYHLVNVVLHAVVCALYLRLCHVFLPPRGSCIAGFLFAVHPVHTEAVAGVVGRAEILSALFFLLAFLSYIRSICKNRENTTSWWNFLLCLVCTVLATLSKEQGITVAGICIVYDLLLLRNKVIPFCAFGMAKNESGSAHYKETIVRVSLVAFGAAVLVACRMALMNGEIPVFTKFDNPAACAESSVRYLTYHYLVALNTWLLLFPCDLCCDWTMGSVPVVQSLRDPRVLATLFCYMIFAVILSNGFLSEDFKHSRAIIVGLSLMALPFLPASNLLFPVGFVVAERILYIPSMGFCWLVGYGCHIISWKTKWRKLFWSILMLVLCIHAMKTIIRNMDWKNEYTIFMAGLKVNQKNAKLYNNVGHVLENQGKIKEALEYFLTAVRIQPDDVGAYINVGRAYANLDMFREAEETLTKAKDLLVGGGVKSRETRIAPGHLNVFVNLANIISRDPSRLYEADKLYQQAISMRADYVQAYINRGDILIRLNRTQEAQAVFEMALTYDESNADIYYNLGVSLLEQNKVEEALIFFNKALDLNPSHQHALLNSAIIIQEQDNPDLRKLAYQRLSNLLHTNAANERIYFNLGMLAMGDAQHGIAERWFRQAIHIKSDFRSALFNLALVLFNSSRPLEAIPFLQQLIQHHPDHVKGYFLLGDIFINYVRDLEAAEKCYQSILDIEPVNIRALHNLCVVHFENFHLEEAERCLTEAISIAPNESFLRTHLDLIRLKRKKAENERLKVQYFDHSGGHKRNDSVYWEEGVTPIFPNYASDILKPRQGHPRKQPKFRRYFPHR